MMDKGGGSPMQRIALDGNLYSLHSEFREVGGIQAGG